VRAAARQLGVERLSRIQPTAALGPAGRSFANAAAILASDLDPPRLLARLKAMERSFGRRPGQVWGPRVLDLDIILWSEGPFEASGLIVPHSGFRERRFVLAPLTEIAPDWRDPLTGATLRQLLARLTRARPVDPAPGRT
jgi:2-amino-4-hydroxy-6-hydroxymethyldihydropteridine diphosphokinase